MELSNTAAWLESLGYVYGDIAPQNLVLDDFERLKLIEFESLEEEGTFGPYGSRKEQFAIGSILYLMTRGFEPYEDDDFGPEHSPIVVDRLRQMEFPELSEGHLDHVSGDTLWARVYRACRKECQAIVDSGALEPK